MAAGKLQHRLAFSSREVTSDGYGNEEGSGWDARFTRWAEIVPLKGGENVLAARLTGVQPVLIRVRLDSDTEDIASDWRATDVNEGTIYALHSVADMEQKREMLTITAEAGVAV